MFKLRIFRSFRYAFQGIVYCFQTQPNFKVHTLGFLFMLSSGLYFDFNTWEWIICLVLSSLVFFAELMNTAIESTVDIHTRELHPLAKAAKDCAAGAVLVVSICSVIVWSMIIYIKI